MIYNLTLLAVQLIFRLLFRLKVNGVENIPQSGGVVLATNHTSFLDPPIVAASVRRQPVCFMARASLFDHLLLGWYISHLNAFPVKRGGVDREAWRHFDALLSAGKQVVLFPEGTRSKDGKLQVANPGSGMMLHRNPQATVVPVRIFGADRIMPKGRLFVGFHKLKVTIGPPVDLKEELASPGRREAYEKIAAKVMAALTALEPPAD